MSFYTCPKCKHYFESNARPSEIVCPNASCNHKLLSINKTTNYPEPKKLSQILCPVCGAPDFTFVKENIAECEYCKSKFRV